MVPSVRCRDQIPAFPLRKIVSGHDSGKEKRIGVAMKRKRDRADM